MSPKTCSRTTLCLAAICALAAAFAAPSRANQENAKSSQAACFARLKKLAGDWFAKDSSGKEHLVLRFRVTAGGSALEETQLPGSEEMVSMYHMDGDSLVMTHYCMLGNQPHLKATAASTPARIEFVCTGHGTNMKSENDLHIHHAVYELTADDHFTSFWGAAKDGKSAGGDEKFEVYRKARG